MSKLLCASRELAYAEIGIGLAAFGRSSSVPIMALSVAIDLVRRAILAQRNPANDNQLGEQS